MSYQAPLKDMRFVLTELAGLSDIAGLEGYADATPDLAESVLEEAGKFAAGVLDPINRTGDIEGSRLDQSTAEVAPPRGFTEAYRQFVDAGWHGLDGSPEFGGQGLPEAIAVPVSEIWSAANLAFSLCPMLTSGAVIALQRHGSEALQQTYLANMVSGRWTGTMNLTEPQAGSDLSQVKTVAVPSGDHYLVKGQKIFITWGEHSMTENIVHLVLARLPDAPPGVKGISLLLVPKFLVNADGSPGRRNDLKCVSLEHKLGIHASPTCVMAFGDAGGAVGYLVGEPHRGLEYMFTMMNHARLGVGVEGLAISERAYQHAVAYARERVQSRAVGSSDPRPAPIVRHPDVRRMLMTMRANIEAMRAIAYVTAAAGDRAHAHADAGVRTRQQAFVDFMIPIVKGWCTEQANHMTSLGVQIHGGMGFIEETGAAQYYRDARITAIYEGTTGIQALDLVNRKLMRDQGATAVAVLGEISRECDVLAKADDAGLAAIAHRLRKAAGCAAVATEWLRAHYPVSPQAAAAGAVPYLLLLGTVTGGWQLARAAQIAHRRLSEGAADAEFYRAKLVTARFFADHCLPLTEAYAEQVTGGSYSVLALAEEAF